MKKIFILLSLGLFSLNGIYAFSSNKVGKIEEAAEITEPEKLYIFRQAYPDVEFKCEYEQEKTDWKITVFADGRDGVELYWCNGSFLPLEERVNKDKYWPLLYEYPEELKDPADLTDEEKEQLKEFSSRENRKNGAGTPMFLFDAIYDSNTRGSLEKHIKQITFLGHRTNVHKRMEEPLRRVEERIKELAKTDEEVNTFVNKIKSNDAYYWRLIDGTNRKSFHSLGIAVDIIPVRITGEIFWSWARDKNPKGWMLTPLSRRWLPPKKVVKIFEEEGFIWGGKWAIWDNMHFEYHPELIIYNKKE